MLNVLFLNGGRGASSLITDLLSRKVANITSIVNAYDDGKSTGQIRDFFKMLGPSDIRKVQEVMLPTNDPNYEQYKAIFSYRFPFLIGRDDALSGLKEFTLSKTNRLVGVLITNQEVLDVLRVFIARFLDGLYLIEKIDSLVFKFKDCSIMNCIYAGAYLHFDRNIEKATKAIDKLFRLRGTVYPTTIENKKLVALRENGEMLYSEAEIVELRSNVRIERIYLLDHSLDRKIFDRVSCVDKRRYLETHNCYVSILESVELSIKQADIIVYAAGTQHSSLYPTYMSSGLAAKIAENQRSLKVFLTNIGADYETPGYNVSDYLSGAYKYLSLSSNRKYKPSELFDYLLINVPNSFSDRHVSFDENKVKTLGVKYLTSDFECSRNPGKHDGKKVMDVVLNLYSAKVIEHQCVNCSYNVVNQYDLAPNNA